MASSGDELNAYSERFLRCLDRYLFPQRFNIDPEDFNLRCHLQYTGHKGPVTSVTTESSGQWIASGSNDGSVRVWDLETGRCVKVWDIGEPVHQVVWNPLPELPLLAIAAGQDVLILNTVLGSEKVQEKIEELLRVETSAPPDDSENNAFFISWCWDDKNGGIRLKHFKTVLSIEWHRKGDYLSTLMSHDESGSVLIHQLSKKLTQRIPYELRGLPVSSAFHPNRSILFISTKKNVHVYDLINRKLIKKLEPGDSEISSIAIHPGGDNVIAGSKDGKLCWFDMNLSSQPYKVLKPHEKDINKVAFHRSYPLFSSCSDDSKAYVFHTMVYSNLNQNPSTVPLRILRLDGGGVLDCKFHPRKPWLFTAASDSIIRLYRP